MFEFVLESLLGVIIECLIALSWWYILFPIVWLLSLPFVLMIALFRNGPYGFRVADMLTCVHMFWREMGLVFTSAM